MPMFHWEGVDCFLPSKQRNRRKECSMHSLHPKNRSLRIVQKLDQEKQKVSARSQREKKKEGKKRRIARGSDAQSRQVKKKHTLCGGQSLLLMHSVAAQTHERTRITQRIGRKEGILLKVREEKMLSHLMKRLREHWMKTRTLSLRRLWIRFTFETYPSLPIWASSHVSHFPFLSNARTKKKQKTQKL